MTLLFDILLIDFKLVLLEVTEIADDGFVIVGSGIADIVLGLKRGLVVVFRMTVESKLQDLHTRITGLTEKGLDGIVKET